MSKKTVFNPLWVNPNHFPEFSSWVSPVTGRNNEAYCKVCKKTINLSNMGKQALVSHKNGMVHIKVLQSVNEQHSLSSFFIKTAEPSSSQKSTAVTILPDSSEIGSLNVVTNETATLAENNNGKEICTQVRVDNKSLNNWIMKDDVTKAEIVWALQIVDKRWSFNSCHNLNETFRLMFPDSHIAQAFTLGPDKCSYIVHYGLAPFFQQQLMNQIKVCEIFVICFDEALNKVVQRGQMDLVIRFWDNKLQKVATRYLTGVFLTTSTSKDLLKLFLEGISPLPLRNLIQVSMDGPNVNIKFLSMLNDHIKIINENQSRLVNLGICGLHVVHGAIKTGIESVEWEISSILCYLHYMFNASPAPRGLFVEIIDCNLFPLKFCGVRWLENVKCLERALTIWDHILKFLK